MPTEWITAQYPNPTARSAYLDRHDLGEVPPDMAGFPAFFAARRVRMSARLRALLAAPAKDAPR